MSDLCYLGKARLLRPSQIIKRILEVMYSKNKGKMSSLTHLEKHMAL